MLSASVVDLHMHTNTREHIHMHTHTIYEEKKRRVDWAGTELGDRVFA